MAEPKITFDPIPSDQIEQISEQFRPLYTEKSTGDDGVEQLAVPEHLKSVTDTISSLTTRLGRVSSDKSAANNESAKRRKELEKWEKVLDSQGIEGEARTPDGLMEHISAIEEQSKVGKENRIEVSKVRETLTATHKKEIEAKDKVIASHLSSIEDLTIGQQINAGLIEAGGNVKLLSRSLKDECVLVSNEDSEGFSVKIKDADGDYRVDGTGAALTIKQRIDELKKDPDYSVAFKSGMVAGEGGTPKATNNPAPNNNRPAGDGDSRKDGPTELPNERAQKSIADGLAAGLAKQHQTEGEEAA